MALSTPDLLKTYNQEKQKLPGAGLPWMNRAREAALESLRETGFPGPKDEAWKYTNVRPILEKGGGQLSKFELSAKELENYLWGLKSGPRIVLVNGVWEPSLSTLSSLPKGLSVLPLSQALENPFVKRFFESSSPRQNPFAAMNTAFFREGVFVYFSRGAMVSEPLHLVSVLGAGSKYGIGETRIVVVADQNSRGSVVESYQGKPGGSYLCNAVAQYWLVSGAEVQRYALQAHPIDCFHLSATQAHLEKESHFGSLSLVFGARVARDEVEVSFEAAGGKADLSGLYWGSGDQQRDQTLTVNHRNPHCQSRQYFKGILAGKARGAFTGKVYVAPGAQKTDAEQSNMNLLLSDDCEADTRPQLEIYADDVKCSHGATVGQLDEAAIFYMRSRGIGLDEARHLLTQGFAEDILSRVHHEPLAKYLSPYLMYWLNDAVEGR